MKAYIKGLEPVNYISKKIGDPVVGFSLFFTFKTGSTWGEKTGDCYVSKESPNYEQFKSFIDEPLKLVGREIELDRNERGFVESLTLLPSSPTK